MMSESICRFIPQKQHEDDLKIIHFVYEADHHKLKQPFLHPFYYLYLVTEGDAVLSVSRKEYKVTVGDVFLTVPGSPYRLEGSGNFRYIYLSFTGSCIRTFFEQLGIDPSEPVYRGYERTTEFWFSAISRVTSSNASFISESVLLYMLSLMANEKDNAEKKGPDSSRFDMILNYVNENFRDATLTLCKVSDIFSYTEKYVSSLFKKHMETGFNKYVNSRRIDYAVRLIDKGYSSVKDIALECGYSDALYFSKVFKKKIGITPTEMIKKRQ